VDQPRTRFEDK